MRRVVTAMVMFAGASVMLGGCSLLFGGGDRPPAHRTYRLDYPEVAQVAEAPGCGTLVLARPMAASGFNGSSLAYIEQAHELDYFAWSTWADPPARMLLPILERGLDDSGLFRRVAAAPASVRADLRLETREVALYQTFDGRASQAVLEAEARVVDVASRSQVAARRFRIVEPAREATPYGGVVAANRAVERLLGELIGFLEPLRPACESATLTSP